MRAAARRTAQASPIFVSAQMGTLGTTFARACLGAPGSCLPDARLRLDARTEPWVGGSLLAFLPPWVGQPCKGAAAPLEEAAGGCCAHCPCGFLVWASFGGVSPKDVLHLDHAAVSLSLPGGRQRAALRGCRRGRCSMTNSHHCCSTSRLPVLWERQPCPCVKGTVLLEDNTAMRHTF